MENRQAEKIITLLESLGLHKPSNTSSRFIRAFPDSERGGPLGGQSSRTCIQSVMSQQIDEELHKKTELLAPGRQIRQDVCFVVAICCYDRTESQEERVKNFPSANELLCLRIHLNYNFANVIASSSIMQKVENIMPSTGVLVDKAKYPFANLYKPIKLLENLRGSLNLAEYVKFELEDGAAELKKFNKCLPAPYRDCITENRGLHLKEYGLNYYPLTVHNVFDDWDKGVVFEKRLSSLVKPNTDNLYEPGLGGISFTIYGAKNLENLFTEYAQQYTTNSEETSKIKPVALQSSVTLSLFTIVFIIYSLIRPIPILLPRQLRSSSGIKGRGHEKTTHSGTKQGTNNNDKTALVRIHNAADTNPEAGIVKVKQSNRDNPETVTSKQTSGPLCIVCEMRPRNVITFPCSHMTMCHYCASQKTTCPKCGAEIRGTCRANFE